MDKSELIKNVLNEIKPFIMSHGGDIEFVEYKDNVLYIKMLGACAGCGMLDATLNSFVYETVKNEVPELDKIVNIS